MINILANTKIYKNYQTSIPKEIREKFNITKDTVVEWGVNENNEIVLKTRKKVTFDDVVGMIKKDDELSDDWDIDKAVYFNE
ncbi:MAG: AbrB/MazE/SpoVT family DNA-binding domain-containing protein [Methanobrevibacter sp.]|nr:AbrB/MazE/SpoVT family DNA-binding domain-containing protein [Methanobrevibacter sp.]